MKKVMLGTLFFLIGAVAALLVFFAKNQSLPKPIITIVKKENGFEQTKFSLQVAPSDSLKGQITAMDGNVWRQERTATEPAKLTEPITVQQGEILVASDEGKLTVNFNPALSLTLLPQTEVEIVQTLPLNLVFNQKRGTAQYQVSDTSPVTVRSLNLIVNLDSGFINIGTDDQTGEITLSLKTGQARIGYNSPEFESKVWNLDPGDIFKYDSNERKGYFNAP